MPALVASIHVSYCSPKARITTETRRTQRNGVAVIQASPQDAKGNLTASPQLDISVSSVPLW